MNASPLAIENLLITTSPKKFDIRGLLMLYNTSYGTVHFNSLFSLKGKAMTILGGDYEPVKVVVLDIVGYKGNGEFAILNPNMTRGRILPEVDGILKSIPLCFTCKIENNQVVNFSGRVATLHDIKQKSSAY